MKMNKEQLYKKAHVIVKTINVKNRITSLTIYRNGNVLFNHRNSKGISKGDSYKSSIALYINKKIKRINSKFVYTNKEEYGAGSSKMIFKYYKLKSNL